MKIQFDTPVNFASIGFKSANDCPHRDPNKVTVKFDSGYGQHASVIPLKFEAKRWHTLNFPGVCGQTKEVLFEFENATNSEI